MVWGLLSQVSPSTSMNDAVIHSDSLCGGFCHKIEKLRSASRKVEEFIPMMEMFKVWSCSLSLWSRWETAARTTRGRFVGRPFFLGRSLPSRKQQARTKYSTFVGPTFAIKAIIVLLPVQCIVRGGQFIAFIEFMQNVFCLLAVSEHRLQSWWYSIRLNDQSRVK